MQPFTNPNYFQQTVPVSFNAGGYNPYMRNQMMTAQQDMVRTSVVQPTVVFDVDGKEVSMRKVQKRTFKKDGISYADDNTYYINEVPKSLKDFNEYLEVEMETFKMCDNINAFLNQKTAEMREFLFSLAGNITDLDIARSKEELSELLPLLDKYSAEELTAMNKATKSKITKELPILDGQIKEKERDIQIKQDMDVSDLELLKNSLKEQIADCVAKQTDNDKLLAEYDKTRADILDLKFKQGDLSRKSNEDNIKARREIEDKISDKQFLVVQTEKTISETEHCIEFSKQTIEMKIQETTTNRVSKILLKLKSSLGLKKKLERKTLLLTKFI